MFILEKILVFTSCSLRSFDVRHCKIFYCQDKYIYKNHWDDNNLPLKYYSLPLKPSRLADCNILCGVTCIYVIVN